MKKILIFYFIFFINFSFSQQVAKDELIDKLIPLLNELNYLFDSTISILPDNTSWADVKNNAIRLEGSECAYELKLCQIVITHEFIHLIKDNHESRGNHNHISEKNFYFKTFKLSGKNAEDKFDGLNQIEHSNTNVLAIKTLLVLKFPLTKSDIERYFENLRNWIRNNVKDKKFMRQAFVANQWSFERTLQAFNEGLNRNDFYAKIGTISNFNLIKNAFKDYPQVLSPFKEAEQLYEECIFFPADFSIRERKEFLPLFLNKKHRHSKRLAY